jgi:hypothetical protein
MSKNKNQKIGDRLLVITSARNITTMDENEALDIIQTHANDAAVINARPSSIWRMRRPTIIHCWTPIFHAVARENFKIAHALMRAPALDINRRDQEGFNILSFAMASYPYDHELIKYLLTRDDIDVHVKTWTLTESYSFKAFFGLTKPGAREASCQRGASALYFATTHKELFQYIPALLNKMKSGVNDFVECRFASGTDKYFDKFRSPITNLIDALPDCNQTERLFVLSCIERMASTYFRNMNKNIGYESVDKALDMAVRLGDKQLVETLLKAGAFHDEHIAAAAKAAHYSGHPEVAELFDKRAAMQERMKMHQSYP